MTDIANLGLSIDSSQAAKASTALDSFASSAKGAEQAADKLSTTSYDLAKAAAAAEKAIVAKATATLSSLKASADATKEEIAAAQQVKLSAAARYDAAKASLAHEAALLAAARASNTSTAANNKAAPAIKSAAVNAGSLTAQLQDVAVQLQAGQSPMTVAIQQGTQMALAFGDVGAAGAAAGLGAAIRGLFSPVALLSVGIVALTGYAIQWATSSASATDKATEALKRHDEVLKLIKERYPQIATERDKAFNSAVGLKSEEVNNLRAYQKALDELSKTLATTSKQMSMRSEVMASPAGGASAEAIDQWNRLRQIVDEFRASGDNSAAAVANFRDRLAELNVDATDPAVQKYATQVYEVAKNAAQAGANVSSMQGTISALDSVMPGATANLNAYAVAMANMRLAVTSGAGEDAITTEANKALSAAQTMSQALETAREAQNALVKLQYPGGNVPTPEAKPNRESILYSTDKKASSDAARAAEQYRRLVETGKARISTLQAEQQALGLTAEQAARLHYEQEILNRAQVSGLNLTPKQTQELKDLAAQMAATDAANQRMQENWDLGKDVAKGFMSTFISDIRNGESAWKSFGDAANSVLDKIINKLEDSVINSLFTNSSSGGLGLGSLFSGLLNFNALGGVYGSQGAMAFANGGAFTNSIVSKPTLFPFANGTGLMGEAGPEAIMPLSRDSSGRLGVKASGGGGVTNVSVAGATVNIAGNTDTSTAAEIKQSLDQFNRELPAKVIAAVRDGRARGKI